MNRLESHFAKFDSNFKYVQPVVEDNGGLLRSSVTCERNREAAVIFTVVKQVGRALTGPTAGFGLRIFVAVAFLTVLFGLQAIAVGL